MCVLVLNVFLAQQAVELGQIFENRDVGIKNKHTLKALAGLLGQLALCVNRAQNRQLVFQAGFKVDIAVTGSGMNAAGTSFGGYIISHNYQRAAVVVFGEGMYAFSIFHFLAQGGAKHVAQILVADSTNLIQQVLSHKEHLALAFNPGIFQRGVQRNSDVGRHSPRGSSPNYHVSLFALGSLRHLAVILNQRHLYEDGRGLLLAIFNFCFSQSGFAMRAPVNGLFTLVDITLVGHAAKYADLLCLKAVVQRYIGMLPITQNAQTLKVLALDVNPL